MRSFAIALIAAALIFPATAAPVYPLDGVSPASLPNGASLPPPVPAGAASSNGQAGSVEGKEKSVVGSLRARHGPIGRPIDGTQHEDPPFRHPSHANTPGAGALHARWDSVASKVANRIKHKEYSPFDSRADSPSAAQPPRARWNSVASEIADRIKHKEYSPFDSRADSSSAARPLRVRWNSVASEIADRIKHKEYSPFDSRASSPSAARPFRARWNSVASEVANRIKHKEYSPFHSRADTPSFVTIFDGLSTETTPYVEQLIHIDSSNATFAQITGLAASIKASIDKANAELRTLAGEGSKVGLSVSDVADIVGGEVKVILAAAGDVLVVVKAHSPDLVTDVEDVFADLGATVTSLVEVVVNLVDGVAAPLAAELHPVVAVIAELKLTALAKVLDISY